MYFDALKFKILCHLLKKALRYYKNLADLSGWNNGVAYISGERDTIRAGTQRSKAPT